MDIKLNTKDRNGFTLIELGEFTSEVQQWVV